MKRFLRVNTRQLALLVVTALVAICILTVKGCLLPAYEELSRVRSTAKSRAAEYAKLTRNLLISESIDARYKQHGKAVAQTGNDQKTLSNFLRDLEIQARRPNMTIVNIKPLPVTTEATHNVYQARVSVSGKLQEILKFVSNLANTPTVIGLDSFSLRGVQGINTVECSLRVRSVRVVSGKAKGNLNSEHNGSSEQNDDK